MNQFNSDLHDGYCPDDMVRINEHQIRHIDENTTEVKFNNGDLFHIRPIDPNKIYFIGGGAGMCGIEKHIQEEMDALIREKPEIMIVLDDKILYNGTGNEVSDEDIARGISIRRESAPIVLECPKIRDIYFESPASRKDINQPWKKRGKNSKGSNKFFR